MDQVFNKKFRQTQKKLLNCISRHQECYEKIKNGDQSMKSKDELQQLKNYLLKCSEDQKVLMHELDNQVVSDSFSFNLFKIPPGAVAKKNRRRKDKLRGTIDMSVVNTRESVRARSISPKSSSSESSSSESSSESEEDEHMIFKATRANPKLLNTPRSRPTLLPKKIQEPIKIAAPEMQPPNLLALTIERQYLALKEKNSPKKGKANDEMTVEEHSDLRKIQYMTALSLMPKEIANEVMETVNRKKERKRRSTANNQFVYNNDWEMPISPSRPKQYLSPVKFKVLAAEAEPSSMIHDAERMETCGDCDSMAVALECTRCMRLFHPKCPKVVEELMQSFLLCRKCFMQSGTSREIDTWGKRDKSCVYGSQEIEERSKVRDHLRKIVRFRALEKAELEKLVLKHNETAMHLKKHVNMQIQDGQDLEKKIKLLADFVRLFQKESKPETKPDEELEKKPEEELEDSTKEMPQVSPEEMPDDPTEKITDKIKEGLTVEEGPTNPKNKKDEDSQPTVNTVALIEEPGTDQVNKTVTDPKCIDLYPNDDDDDESDDIFITMDTSMGAPSLEAELRTLGSFS